MTSVENVPTATVPARRDSLAALRFPLYRLLWVSGLLVFLSVMAQNVARGWLARELTGSNAGLGGVLLGFGLPMLVATPWGGVAADRLSKRAVLIVSVALLALSSAFVGFALAFDVVQYWMLVVASGIQAIAFALYGPARMAFIGQLVDEEAVPNAIVLGLMSNEGMRVAGPAVAGVVIGGVSFGTEAIFLGGAALLLLGMFTLFRLPEGLAAAGRPQRSPFAELREGLAYVRDDRALRLLVLTSLGIVMLGFPYLAFLPTVADELFDVGSGGYGLMSAIAAGGAVVAAMAAAGMGGRHNPWRLLYLAGAGFGLSVIALGLAPEYWVALAVLPAVGATGLLFQTTNQSLLLELAAFEYHGRIQGLVMLGFSGFGIAALPLGVLADAIGLRTTFVLMGAGVVATVGASAVRSQTVRRRATVTLDLG